MAEEIRIKPKKATVLKIQDLKGREVELPADLQETCENAIIRAMASKVSEMKKRGIEPIAWWEASHSWD